MILRLVWRASCHRGGVTLKRAVRFIVHFRRGYCLIEEFTYQFRLLFFISVYYFSIMDSHQHVVPCCVPHSVYLKHLTCTILF